MHRTTGGRLAYYGGLGVWMAVATGACAVETAEPVAEKQQEILVSSSLQFGSVSHGASSRGNYHFTGMFEWGTDQPVVVVGDPSYNASDPTTVRVRNVSSSGFETALREWDYLDGSHTTEKMGFLAHWPSDMGSSNGFPEPPPGRSYAIKAHRVEGVTHARKYVPFETQFITKPVVFATQVTHNGGDPTIVRIWDVTTDGFNVQLQEERGNDGSHTAETINYVAIEQDFTFRFRASSDTNGLCSYMNTFSVDTDETWVRALRPAIGHVLVGLQTKNGGDPANARWRPVTDCSGKICKEVLEVRVDEEASDGESEHAVETIGGLRMWLDRCDYFQLP